MRIFTSLLTVFALVCSANAISQERSATLKSKSLYCYKSSDLTGLENAFDDGNNARVMRYFESGQCVLAERDLRIAFLESANRGRYALIQLPSGKTAYSFIHAIK